MKFVNFLKIYKLDLWKQILLALILGILAGTVLGPKSENLRYFGVVFINLIKMLVIPLILFSLVSAITALPSSQKASWISAKSVLSFLATSIVAVVLGITITLIMKPGKGVTLPEEIGNSYHPTAQNLDMLKFVVEFIPDNIVLAMSQGNIIQVIIFSILLGITVLSVKDKCPNLVNFMNEGSTVLFRMIENIVKIAPLGVFGYMAWSVGTQGVDILLSLAKLVAIIIFCCVVQYILYGVYIFAFARLNPFPFFVKMIEPKVLAFSTSSSKATLTTTMRVMNEQLGVSKSSTNFVLPIGTSINMNGGAIYLSSACIFFAQAFNIDLDITKIIALVFTCTIGSIGAAGIPSGILLFLGMSLETIGLPTELVVLVAGIDRILDMFTTMINVLGDACITMIVDKSEKTLDINKYYQLD